MQAVSHFKASAHAEVASHDIHLSVPPVDDESSKPASPNIPTELPARSVGTRSQQQRPTEWVKVRVLTGMDFVREELEYEYVMVDRQFLSGAT